MRWSKQDAMVKVLMALAESSIRGAMHGAVITGIVTVNMAVHGAEKQAITLSKHDFFSSPPLSSSLNAFIIGPVGEGCDDTGSAADIT